MVSKWAALGVSELQSQQPGGGMTEMITQSLKWSERLKILGEQCNL